MITQTQTAAITLEPQDNKRLAALCGQLNEHLHLIEQRLGVELNNRGNVFQVIGDSQSVKLAIKVIETLYSEAQQGSLSPARVHLLLQEVGSTVDEESPGSIEEVVIQAKRKAIKGRGKNQHRYLKNILSHDINFGIGPAGTGKTYLAVACAVHALERDEVRRIILTRPAVEAGERLGFLPGDLEQKIDPYLRPLYDALYDMLGLEQVAKMLERNVIEIAPLAYMRGRTLNESFIILDEAQNTTIEQMKMFLTRIGFGSRAVITGDVTQTDLPPRTASGLRQVVEVLKDVNDISFTFFKAKDVVRHPLVQSIVEAYEDHEQKDERASDTAS